MTEDRRGSKGWCLVLGALALILAVVARVAYLSHFPQQIHNDEASTVTRGFRLVSEWTLAKIFSGSEFGGHPSFGFWLASIPSTIFGEQSIWTLRISSAVLGVLSVIIFTAFVNRAYGYRVALIFLAVCAPFHLHVHYSRTGFIYIHAVLLAALVSYAFGRFIQSTAALWAFITGLAMGLAMLVYPATQVLPLGMVAAVVLGVMPPSAKTRVLVTSPGRFALLAISGIIGGLVTFGAQLTHIISHGYLSRLNSTFILQPHNIKHISSVIRVESASDTQVVVFNLLETLKFFYRSDSGEQYNFTSSPLPIWMAVFALIGVGALCRMALKREPNSIYILTVSLATFFASALMVEANFSPHLVLFALIIPLVCALGVSAVFARFKGLKNWVLCLVLAAGLIVWSNWNWSYYSRVVDPLRPRISSIETRFLNLPVDNWAVKRFINLSGYDLKFDESHIELVYPNGEVSFIAGGSAEERARLMDLNAAGLTLLLVDLPLTEKVESIFKERGARIESFEYPGIPLSYLSLQMASPN